MPLLSKFKQSVKRSQLINANDTIVIGVSGGPDSVCLVYLLRALQKEYGLTLSIAHLDHMLRGKDSEKDARFVFELSEKLKIPAFFKKVAIAKLAQKGSFEELARKERFDFFFETAKKVGAKKIALGHTLDDQAETVLMRMLRGSGLMGLAGILPRKKMGDFVIIRPLLEIQRSEIETFLRLRKITPRIDITNQSEVYLRNRIRHKLLGELKKYNPNIKTVLAATAEHIALDYDYLLAAGSKAFQAIKTIETGSCVRLDLKKFFLLHPALQNLALRFTFERLKGDTRRLTARHIKEIKDMAYNRPIGSIVDLPFKISLRLDKACICAYFRNR
ncbi:MAG: tRNA lysidine(34) synthetase TilS [Omnitrophica WOR_2 bacterium GWF2_43_52]|nr:MAG: tRNA lysidine(34) synthetase TilS [Omnitrophica WOR_2 bacterium GWA2_44_7]OGX14038.1 MAG: tRNA lysidine(34) synthetase TilS [Omnitrophica WOR_2 bacterium GWC2_44_8]OGX20962.1 MAG: tRNA lysidine(34) synthetase TilS [Omnitrophica WOR_2 bacterium GWF2_43_52]OGX52855.1 MAG: tRNA lysidine(34) synthetase TilS [Omnitrophica WOR_2 bacterium RIFOXYC2_FULL_43_9]HAH21141.1 tRNA lysidine(34) synthetase TilS [Candidatus Omnitrophota bacterium]